MGLTTWNQADVGALASINSAALNTIAWNGVGFDLETSAYAIEVLSDSPVLYWKLDETSGTDADDVSGNGYDGTYVAGYTQNQSPIVTSSVKSVLLNGSTGRVLDGTAHPLVPTGSEAVTLECWCHLTRTPAGSSNGIIYLGSSAPNEFGVHCLASGNIRLFGNGGTYMDSTGGEVNINETHYIVATWNGSNSVKLWIDAVEIGEDTTTTPSYTGTYVQVGGIRGGATLPFQGYIDEVAVYDYALTQTQIESHYAVGD